VVLQRACAKMILARSHKYLPKAKEEEIEEEEKDSSDIQIITPTPVVLESDASPNTPNPTPMDVAPETETKSATQAPEEHTPDKANPKPDNLGEDMGGPDQCNRDSGDEDNGEVLLEGKRRGQTPKSKRKSKHNAKPKTKNQTRTIGNTPQSLDSDSYDDTGKINDDFQANMQSIKKGEHHWEGTYPEDSDRVAVMYYDEFWGASVIKSKNRQAGCGWMGEVKWDDGKKGSVRWEKDKWLPIPLELDVTGMLM
jgi:hypothetical protein